MELSRRSVPKMGRNNPKLQKMKQSKIAQVTMKTSKFLFKATLTVVAGVMLPEVGRSIGVRIPNQSPAAIARANAFTATADDASAVYYNPAGITQIQGHEVQVGALNYMGINTSYESPTGGDTQSRFEVLPIPQLYYAYTPSNSPVSLGLGLYSPFGLAVKWPETSGFRSIAIESRLTYLTMNPVVAWKVHPTLSVGAGPTVNYSKIEFVRGLFAPNDIYSFKGDDLSFGFNVGALWQPLEKWSFGINYRGSSRSHFKGDSSYANSPFPFPVANSTTKASIEFPQIIVAGVSYRPNELWNFEFNIDYTEWNQLNTVMLEGTSAMFGPVTGGADLGLQLDWHESWQFGFGVTRQLENHWFVSGGYFYSTATSPTQTFTPAIPDTALHVASLGFGRKGEVWSFVLAGQFAMGEKRNVNNSQPNPATAESANGKYQLIVPTLSLSLSRKF